MVEFSKSDFEHLLGHSFRVSNLSVQIGKMMNKNGSEINLKVLKKASFFHDIGKLKISPSILNKSKKLNEKEFLEVQNHSLYAFEFLENIDVECATIIRHHHENFNGTGYPGKLKGFEIPLYSRIIRVSDVFDALTSKRCYKKTFSSLEAIEIMENENEFYDQEVFKILKKFLGIN